MVAVTSPVSVIRCCWCSSFSSELQIVSSMLQQMCDGCHSPPSLKKRRGLLFGEERARTGSDSYPGAPAAAAATVALAESVFKVGNCTTSPSPSSNEKTKTKDEKRYPSQMTCSATCAELTTGIILTVQQRHWRHQQLLA